MELVTLLERLQSRLLVNDKRLDEIDASRTDLKRICQEEQGKISTMCIEVQARVGAAGESLKVKMVTEYNKFDEEMAAMREKIRKDSLVLCPELEKITELMKMDEGHKFDIEECWENIKIIVSSKQEGLSVQKMPTFHPSKTMAKVKSPDLGFLNVAEYLPSQYQLALTSSASNHLEASMDAKAICTVTTNQQFTEMIQANIKFSIKNKACKEAVPYCKEECKLSEDKKSFHIAFMVQRPGTYVVTVLLYDQHVTDSPLTLMVSETQLKEEIVEISLGQPAIPQRVSPPVEKPINVHKSGEAPVTKRFDTPLKTPNLKILTPPTVAPPLRQPILPPSKVVPPTPPVKPTGVSSPSLPPGLLNLSHITPGGRLAGLRMLSIEEGAKEDSLHKPIGMCLLHDGNIVVASTFEDKVKIFTPSGKFVSLVTSPKPTFDRPSDMVTLQSGQFVVRDNSRVQVFSAGGIFLKNIMQNRGQDKCYGLAQDKDGRLITIMESRRPRKTDLLFFDLDSGELVKKIEMEEIIANMAMSKCRFLTYQLGKLYITDLGLDCVYILDPITINAKVFGSSGSGAGQLSDPAGLVVDSVGNIIVADSKNHRLCLYSSDGKFVCNLSLSPDTRRPSGVVLDKEQKDIYVLNLQGRAAMTKYRLK